MERLTKIESTIHESSPLEKAWKELRKVLGKCVFLTMASILIIAACAKMDVQPVATATATPSYQEYTYLQNGISRLCQLIEPDLTQGGLRVKKALVKCQYIIDGKHYVDWNVNTTISDEACEDIAIGFSADGDENLGVIVVMEGSPACYDNFSLHNVGGYLQLNNEKCDAVW